MVVDGSALLVMLLGGPEADALADRLETASRRTTHPLAVYEATAGLSRVNAQPVLASYQSLAEFLAAAGIEVVPVGPPETIAAVEAFSRFGKGQGHPAELTMGACFSYACAQVWGLRLLSSGNGVGETDLA